MRGGENGRAYGFVGLSFLAPYAQALPPRTILSTQVSYGIHASACSFSGGSRKERPTHPDHPGLPNSPPCDESAMNARIVRGGGRHRVGQHNIDSLN